MRLPLRALPVTLLLAAAGCAAARGSGFANTTFHAPPYHAGRAVGADTTPVAHLPVSFQRGAEDPEPFEPDPAKDMGLARLLGDIDMELDALGVSRRVTAGSLPNAGAPDVRFGCKRDFGSSECAEEDRGVFGGGTRRPLELRAGKPAARWNGAARSALADGRTRLLVITLEIGEYPLRDGGLRGRPSIDLGSGHREVLPALQRADVPLPVLQLTGALLDPDGTVLRAGAEGIHAKRTNALLGALGVQALFRDEDFREIRGLRREDLPDQPLAWRVALRELVSGLLERPIAAR